MFGGRGKSRVVVATVVLGLRDPGGQTILPRLQQLARQLADSGRTMEAAADALAQVVSILLDHEDSWDSVATWGEVFNREEDAAAYASEVFADLMLRYQGGTQEEPSVETLPSRHVVVALTVGYPGHEPAIESDLTDDAALRLALSAIGMLAADERLLLVQLHHLPTAAGHPFSDDQMLVAFPELVNL